jgi:hypothetical protein
MKRKTYDFEEVAAANLPAETLERIDHEVQIFLTRLADQLEKGLCGKLP